MSRQGAGAVRPLMSSPPVLQSKILYPLGAGLKNKRSNTALYPRRNSFRAFSHRIIGSEGPNNFLTLPLLYSCDIVTISEQIVFYQN